MKRYTVKDEAAMAALAERIVREAGWRGVFALHGEMGVGKTRFAQGVAAAMGVTTPVCSPTFGIAHLYESPHGTLAHLDLYRLPDEAAVEAFGFEDILAQAVVAVIEWPERAGSLLPPGTRHIVIDFGSSPDDRTVRVN
ncbi:MAG: tRNA (adenosine(37)-N6)-threonylcarbamoyltransferase complex ATPase subunit type 1 TsaE [Kiritimatiellaeota bacterium]|nr:tRNA (adenosine(37)-N6)-threonylcarbamoyltransferase complex ATPase subunit type 1 TsaE [Kiritimatiellota bacterium]